ncbi:MAG: class I SAM-dependent methyltransferase [Ignavibacteriaceae bacterium]|nr:class I SAM-dependent methyltransferase [Ignavibacteriaceae bacterium]
MKDCCPVCNSDKKKEIGLPKINLISKRFVDKEFKIVQCNNCELYYVSPKIDFNSSQWNQLYNSEYFSNQSNWLLEKRKKELAKRFDTARSLIENQNQKLKYLDVGAGEGKGLLEAHGRGWEATGIDIVDNRLQDAKLSEIKFIKSNLLECDLPENHFDFIYVDSVIEHVLNPFEYLSKIKKLLRKGGVIYIGVPNEDCLFNSVRKLVFVLTGKKNESEKLKPFDSPYHVIGFNDSSLKYFLDKIELRVLKKRNFGRKFDFLSYSPKSKSFWIGIFFLFPVEYIGQLIQRDIYFEAYLSWNN